MAFGWWAPEMLNVWDGVVPFSDIGHSFFFLIILFLSALGLRCCAQAFLRLWRAGATLHCGAWASHCSGFSCCRARALGTQASVVVATGLVVLRHVGSSRTRDRTPVPCIGRQILNHCATREAPDILVGENSGYDDLNLKPNSVLHIST